MSKNLFKLFYGHINFFIPYVFHSIIMSIVYKVGLTLFPGTLSFKALRRWLRVTFFVLSLLITNSSASPWRVRKPKCSVPGELPARLRHKFGPELAVPATRPLNNEHIRWCPYWNESNGYKYSNILNGDLNEKLEALKQIKENTKKKKIVSSGAKKKIRPRNLKIRLLSDHIYTKNQTKSRHKLSILRKKSDLFPKLNSDIFFIINW